MGVLKFPSIQKKLLEAWNDCLDQRKQKTDVLILNGEPSDGAGEIAKGLELWSGDIIKTTDDAYNLLEPYKPKMFIATRGSGYHSDHRGLQAEELIMQKFGKKTFEINPYEIQKEVAFRDDDDKRQKRVYNFAFFDVFGNCFSVAHHISHNKWFAYMTTALAREMAELTLAADKWLPATYDYQKLIVARSHTHNFVEVRYVSSLGFKTPAWKLPDWFLHRGGLGGAMPHIGTVEVIIEPNGEIAVHPHVIEAKKYPKVRVPKLF